MKDKILFIGGGTAGLTTAIALQRKQINFIVFEAVHEITNNFYHPGFNRLPVKQDKRKSNAMTPLYFITALGFVLLTALFFGLVLRHLRTALAQTGWPEEKQKLIRARTMIVFILWAVFIAVFSLSGFSQRFEWFPLNLAPMLLIPLIGILIVTFSGKMKHLLKFIPMKVLTRLQVFRVFVEILLWVLFLKNILPVQMTFEGRNFDILAGITAPLMAYWFAENRKAMLVWNILCLALLFNIVTLAILSTPTPIRMFHNDPANTIVTYFPFIFLPGFLVPLAYGLHFFSLRKLLIKS